MSRSVVVFRAGGRYALPVDAVQEVLAYEEPRPVEGVPAFLEGVVEVRGVVLPVVDLRPRLGGKAGSTGGEARILALEAAGALVGGVVDDVHAVLRIDPGTVAAPDADAAPWVAGTFDDDAGTVTLLEADALLADNELTALIGT